MSQEQCTTLLNDVQEIKHAVVGNEKFGHEGLVARVTRLEQYREADKKRWAMIYGGAAVVAYIVAHLSRHL